MKKKSSLSSICSPSFYPTLTYEVTGGTLTFTSIHFEENGKISAKQVKLNGASTTEVLHTVLRDSDGTLSVENITITDKKGETHYLKWTRHPDRRETADTITDKQGDKTTTYTEWAMDQFGTQKAKQVTYNKDKVTTTFSEWCKYANGAQSATAARQTIQGITSIKIAPWTLKERIITASPNAPLSPPLSPSHPIQGIPALRHSQSFGTSSRQVHKVNHY